MCLYVYRLNQLELDLHTCTLLCMSFFFFVHAQVSVCFCTLRLSTITRLSHSHHLTSSSIQTLHNFLIIQPTSLVMKGPQPQRETEKHTHTKRSELPTSSADKPQSSYCMFTTNQRFFVCFLIVIICELGCIDIGETRRLTRSEPRMMFLFYWSGGGERGLIKSL